MIEDEAYEQKVSKRAVRRHHNERMKNKTKRMFKDVWHAEYMLTEDRIGKWCDNLAMCSCGGCGNQRKWVGKTLQERKASQSEADYLDEDMPDGYWNWVSGYNRDKDYCCLCEKEFFGVCNSCGYRPKYWWG